MSKTESSESSRNKAGGAGCLAPNTVAIPRMSQAFRAIDHTGDTGDLGGEDKTGPSITARSDVHEKDYRLSNSAKAKPPKAPANCAVWLFANRFRFFLAVSKKKAKIEEGTMMYFLVHSSQYT